jgi:hypothetical protein
MFVPREKRAAYFHTTGCNPHIINGNFSSFFYEMEIDEGIFSGNILVDVENLNLKLVDNVLEFLLIVFLLATFHKSKSEFSDDNRRQIYFFTKIRDCIHNTRNSLRKITVNISIQNKSHSQSPSLI